MANILYIIGEILLIAALLGLVGVLIWVVRTALHVKNTTVGHAKRLSERPIAAGKNLAATVKGLAQQEAVRAKHIGASVKDAAHAVQGAATHIQEAAQSVHPDELKPAVSSLQNVTKALRVAAQLSQAAPKQKPR